MNHVRARAACSHPALAGVFRAHVFRVDRSTVSGAIREVRPLPAARGFAIPDRPFPRIRALEDLFAFADAEGVGLRIDGTEVRVRRPRAGRKAFVSGKEKQNTIKTTTFGDGQGRTLLSGVVRPGRMHDLTRYAPRVSPSSSGSTPRSKRRSTRAAEDRPTSPRAVAPVLNLAQQPFPDRGSPFRPPDDAQTFLAGDHPPQRGEVGGFQLAWQGLVRVHRPMLPDGARRRPPVSSRRQAADGRGPVGVSARPRPGGGPGGRPRVPWGR
ncbi:transposase family protein [Streptomyces albidoflavus]|uniref:transposase family protein n=1 Tax=Streptomyces albidoflavus TaxID=1886 RepID=UPI000282FB3C|nr:transposase family protein [Streptomyces albidoflavus]